MSDPWYRFAPSEERLAQGDLVFDCPLLNWSTAGPLVTDAVTEDRLGQLATGIRADVVVVTKACDMEQDHVSNVVLCPHLGLDEHRTLWEGFMRAKGQNPTPKAWRNYCDDIRGKQVWNPSFLNEAKLDAVELGLRIDDFREVFTIPREVVQSLLRSRGRPRPQLLPPYREHLSQAFARFFMRVGLPTPVTRAW